MMRRLVTLLGMLIVATLIPVAQSSAAEPARSILDINYNQDEIGPPDSKLNSLDLYLPSIPDDDSGKLRPTVIWVHGGGLMVGDKANRMPDKVKLFNELGYLVVSVNYRLSPTNWDFDPLRVRAPDHIADLGEAVGWVGRNIAGYGGDPDRIVLIGHSAGAYLVTLAGVSPAWIEGRQVSRRQIIGVVSLDTDNFDIRKEASDETPFERRMNAWNVFGTPQEEAIEPRWERMSPIAHADPSDPDVLLVTSQNPLRLAANRDMAVALGQDPDRTVLGVPLSHEEINTVLGSPGDTTEETRRVSEFVQASIAAAQPAGVKVTRRPASRVKVWLKRGQRKARSRKISFAFRGTGRATGLQCRIDGKKYSKCRSPRSYWLRPGKHTFRVRSLYPSGRPGEMRKVTFRIVRRYRR